jgi:hypothetical protein
MIENFGDEYREFAVITGRFVPRVWNWRRVCLKVAKGICRVQKDLLTCQVLSTYLPGPLFFSVYSKHGGKNYGEF